MLASPLKLDPELENDEGKNSVGLSRGGKRELQLAKTSVEGYVPSPANAGHVHEALIAFAAAPSSPTRR
jgi:hypothetical protein